MAHNYELKQKVKVLECGYVALDDVMGCDEDIVQAARISYDHKGKSADERLIRRLYRDRHTSPFEMCELKFQLSMPIFVQRQWIRHRTASVNEVSARYTQLPNELHLPELDDLKPQSKINKQGREGGFEEHTAHGIRKAIRYANRRAYDTYEELLDEYGLTRELARGVLPVNTYTKFVWKINLHNLLHFLKLRTDPHAQKEIRVYADVIAELVNDRFPMTFRAWVDYSQEAYNCSRMEVAILRRLLSFYMYRRKVLSDEDSQKALEGIDRWAAEIMTKAEVKQFREKFIA